MKSNWNGTGYAPSTTYHHECPEHNQKNKLGNSVFQKGIHFISSQAKILFLEVNTTYVTFFYSYGRAVNSSNDWFDCGLCLCMSFTLGSFCCLFCDAKKSSKHKVGWSDRNDSKVHVSCPRIRTQRISQQRSTIHSNKRDQTFEQEAIRRWWWWLISHIERWK